MLIEMVQKRVKRKHRKVGKAYRKRSASKLKKVSRAKLHRRRR